MVRKFGINMYTLLYLKWITNKDLLYSAGSSSQCYVAAWMGREFEGNVYMYMRPEWEGSLRENVYMYMRPEWDGSLRENVYMYMRPGWEGSLRENVYMYMFG